jgi:hypothetical protein
MRLKLCSILGVTLCLLGMVSPLVFAAEPPSRPPLTAQLIAVEGASHTYRLIDHDGRVITATVPSQSVTDIQARNPDGTVRATLAAIDLSTNRAKVKTDAGQTLVLAMAHDALAGLQLGDTVTFVVSPGGQNTAVVSPRGAIATQR